MLGSLWILLRKELPKCDTPWGQQPPSAEEDDKKPQSLIKHAQMCCLMNGGSILQPKGHKDSTAKVLVQAQNTTRGPTSIPQQLAVLAAWSKTYTQVVLTLWLICVSQILHHKANSQNNNKNSCIKKDNPRKKKNNKPNEKLLLEKRSPFSYFEKVLRITILFIAALSRSINQIKMMIPVSMKWQDTPDLIKGMGFCGILYRGRSENNEMEKRDRFILPIILL